MPHGDQRDHTQSQLFSLAVWSHSKAVGSADVVLVGIILEKLTGEISLPFGMHSRRMPLAFLFVLRCQGEYGAAK